MNPQNKPFQFEVDNYRLLQCFQKWKCFFSIWKFYEQIQNYNQFVDISRYNKEKFLNFKLKLGEAVIYWHNDLEPPEICVCVSVTPKLSPRPFEAKPVTRLRPQHEKQAYLSDLDWSIHSEICLIESLVVNDGWSYFVCCLYLCLSIIASPDTGYLTTARQHNNYTISSHHSNQCLPSAIKINISLPAI